MNRLTRTARELHDLVIDLGNRMSTPNSIGARPQRMAAIESRIMKGLGELGGYDHMAPQDLELIARKLEAMASTLTLARQHAGPRDGARTDLLLTVINQQWAQASSALAPA